MKAPIQSFTLKPPSQGRGDVEPVSLVEDHRRGIVAEIISVRGDVLVREGRVSGGYVSEEGSLGVVPAAD